MLSYLAQDVLDLAETAKHLEQRMNEPREFDFVPLKRAVQHLVEKPKRRCDFEDKNIPTRTTVFVDNDFGTQ